MSWRCGLRWAFTGLLWCLTWTVGAACTGVLLDDPEPGTGAPDGGAPPGAGGDASCDGPSCGPTGTECDDVTCDERSVCSHGQCVSRLTDGDGDTYLVDDDCDDQDATVFPGVSLPCSNDCGQGLVTCQAGGTWSSCSAPEDCNCTGEQTQSESCGRCGRATRPCIDNHWGDLGSCAGEGPCQPEAVGVRDCGACQRQQRLCQEDCQWDDWGDCAVTGECEPAMTNQPCTTHCGSAGRRDCTDSCVWGACRPPGENNETACHDDTDNDCDSTTDCADPDCVGIPGGCDCRQGATREVNCGNCGTRRQTCNAEGEWRNSGDCTDEGPCSPNQERARSCGECLEERSLCQNDCTWDDWSSCGPVAGCDPTPPCGGTLRHDHCWYLAPWGESCIDFCASHGGYDGATASFVGVESQGGSLSECDQLFDALGYSGRVDAGHRMDMDRLGLGCHLFSGGGLFWLEAPAFNASHSHSYARVVCACDE